MTENELIRKIAEGNLNAFNDLYKLFSSKIYNTCLSYLRNTDEAEETVQDVFVEVHQSAGHFRQEASVSTWIYRLTINKCLDRIRHRKRKKRFGFISSLFDNETGELNHDPPDFNHPGILLENKETALILFKVIETLPENQKTAFILKQIECLPQKEIGLIMKLGEKAVESLLQRAKTNLRKKLSDFYESTEGKKKK